MNAQASEWRGLVAPIEENHAAFRNMVREIKCELDRLQCDPRSRVSGAILLDRLCQMRERLKQHYEDEERLWNRRNGAPLDASTIRWMGAIAAQHRESEQRLEWLVDALERCLTSDDGVLPSCEASTRALLTDVANDEMCEARLFQRAIFEDLESV
jgi:hypothetical protein